jgi:uncharacterized membrane protein YbhN (UPF0104 family)
MATLLCCLVGGALALLANPAADAAPDAVWLGVGVWAVVAAAGLGGAIASPAWTGRALARLVPAAAVRRALDAFERIPRAEAIVLVGLSAVRYAVFSAQFVFLVHAFAPRAAWTAVTAGVAVVYLLKSAVPTLTLGDLGVREGVAVFVLAGAGVPAAAALNASLAVFVVNLVLPAAAGIPLLARLRPPATAREADLGDMAGSAA